MFDYDVVVIGAGVVGCSIARELSAYKLKCIVLEKEEDVCSGTTKANSAIAHSGLDAKPGTNKAKFNVIGNKMMEALSKELDFEFVKNGSLVLCFDEKDIYKLEELKQRGEENGVEGLRIIGKEELREKEPMIADEAVAALYAPTGGIVCPFNMTLAYAENAFANGVEFEFLTKVKDIKKVDGGFFVTYNKDHYYDKDKSGEEDITIRTKTVVNAAGVYADDMHNMVCSDKFDITARKGDYLLFAKTATCISHTIFQLPSNMGKGVLVTPTVHGNMMVGPTAGNIEDKEDISTEMEGMNSVIEKSQKSVKNLPFRSVITSFSGLRAHCNFDDFIIGESSVKGFYDASGIESPGLTAAPAIAIHLSQVIANDINAEKKDDFIRERKGIVRLVNLDFDEKNKLIKENPLYGNITCKCESVTEGEVVDAITRPLGAKSFDGLKRRVRQGMGGCQAGFCTPKTIALLSKYLDMEPEKICKNRPGSNLLMKEEN